MINPFKYRPVSQRDDEDEEVLYHNDRSGTIPLTNFGASKFDDDEVEMELRRKPSTTRQVCSYPTIFVSMVSTILAVLVITLVAYYFNSSGFYMKDNNSTQSTSVSDSSEIAITSSSFTLLSAVSPVPVLFTSSSTYRASSITSVQHKASSEVSSAKRTTTKEIISAITLLPTTSTVATENMPAPLIAPSSTIDSSSSTQKSNKIYSTKVSSVIADMTTSDIVIQSTPQNNVISSTLLSSSSKMSSIITDITTTTSDIVIQSTPQSNVISSSLPTTTSLPEVQEPINWHNIQLDVSSEVTPVVIDVNNDGIDDIIYTYEHFTTTLDIYYCTSSGAYEEACLRDTGQHTCGSTVLAVNGYDGEIIWMRNLTRPAFGIQCNMDVNGDKEIDCFIIGRYAMWEAIDRITGQTLWEVDKSTCFPGYNFYYPLPVKDFDGDGITDIINIHGGDQVYRPNEKDRSPALIVVISGKTGKKLINPLVVPDGRESYMSPVRFYFSQFKSGLILFGTGGETISGSLWAVTVDSIENLLKSEISHSITPIDADGCKPNFLLNVDSFRPKFDKTIYDLSNQISAHDCVPYGRHRPIANKYQLCLYELYKSEIKGLIVPPVIIDMNGDTIQDILLQTFSSRVVLLDGKNGLAVWERNIPYSESYNIPAPFFYNNDSTPDLFLRVNVGEWSDYNYSYVVIINGENGEVLWAMNSSYATMQSAVTVMSENHVQDAVIFFAYNPTNTGSLDGIRRRQTDNDNNDNFVPDNNSMNDDMLANMSSQNYEPVGEADLFDDKNDDENFNDFKLENIGKPFWNLSNSSFPDPIADPKGFIESCHFDTTKLPLELNTYLYFLTKHINENGIDFSIAASYPGILIPGYGMVSSHSPIKRHEDSPSPMGPPRDDSISKHGWRCSYVLSPSSISPLTPVVADLNHDGKLELIYGFQYASDPTYFMYSLSHSALDLHVQTIETMVPTDQDELIDFSVFYPMEKQSWVTYMGTKGDGTYRYSN